MAKRYDVTGWGSPGSKVWFVYDHKKNGLVDGKQFRRKKDAEALAKVLNLRGR